MKLSINNFLNFRNRTEITQKDGIKYTDEINDNNIVIKHTEYDYENDRFIRCDKFDDDGNPVENWWFEYFENGQKEFFNSKDEVYTRTRTDEQVGDLQVRTEKYESKFRPENNYIYEIVRDWSGKMLSFICNGKDLMKEQER